MYIKQIHFNGERNKLLILRERVDISPPGKSIYGRKPKTEFNAEDCSRYSRGIDAKSILLSEHVFIGSDV